MANLEMILEADRRGILPDDKKALLAEARSRGLVGGGDITSDEAPKEQSQEPGTGEYLLDRAKKGFAGFAGFPGDLAEMARDLPTAPHPALVPLSVLMNYAVDSLGLGKAKEKERVPTEKFIATGKTYRDLLGVKNLKTENDALRYAGGIAEMAGAGGPMIAAKGVQALPLITSSIGGGLGLEAGGDIAGGIGVNRQAGEVIGAVAGGIFPSLTGSATHGAVDFLKRKFSPSENKALAETAVAKEVLPLIQGSEASTNLNKSLSISDEFASAGREFAPSLPARTGSPGLLAIEKDLVSRNPKSLERAIENIEKNDAEIAAFINTKFPPGKQTSVQRISKLQKMAADKLEFMRQSVDDKLDEVSAVFESNPNNYEAGRSVRGLVFKQKEIYRGMGGQKYQAVYEAANRLGVTENIDDIVHYTKNVLGSDLNAYQQSEIPSVFRQIRDEFIKESKGKVTVKKTPTGKEIKFYGGASEEKIADISFEKLHSLYKRVNSDVASLRGSMAQDRDFKMMLLGKVKDSLESKIAKFEDSGFGEVADKLKEANRFHREEYIPRFKQGFGDDVLAKHGSGEFRVPNQSVVELITKANNAQAAKDFKLLFDDVPEAWQGLRDGYMDKLIREGNVLGANGRINQKVLDSFLRKHSQTLSEFPNIRHEFEQLSLDNKGLLDRQARIAASQKKLAAADLFKLFDGRDPSIVIPEAISNPNAMRLLVHKARNVPQEGAALARAIAEDVSRQADPVFYFNQNKEAVRVGLQSLGKDHFKNLEIAMDALEINRRGVIPKSVQPGSIAPDAFAEKIGSSPRALIAHYINVARGRTGVNQEAAAFIGRLFDKMRRDHKIVAMESFFYDKDSANAIANLAKQPGSQKFKAEFANAMGSLGIRAVIIGQDSDVQAAPAVTPSFNFESLTQPSSKRQQIQPPISDY